MTELQKSLYNKAISDLKMFCEINNIEFDFQTIKEDSNLECAGEYFHKTDLIKFCPKRCVIPRKNPGFSWSFPGYFVDMTIYGVIIHEFGHLIDFNYNKAEGMPKYKNEKVTNYEPNKNERFAESFKLFISNPELFKQACPKRYKFLTKTLGFKKLPKGDWKQVLIENGASEKYIAASEKRIQSFKCAT